MTEHCRTEDRLDWNDLRYVRALARHGSLSAAARSLKVNHATVARRVAALEAVLGTPLFDRHARGYRATPAAQPVIAAAEQVERSEEHTSELQSLMRISYAVFCLKKKQNKKIA